MDKLETVSLSLVNCEGRRNFAIQASGSHKTFSLLEKHLKKRKEKGENYHIQQLLGPRSTICENASVKLKAKFLALLLCHCPKR